MRVHQPNANEISLRSNGSAGGGAARHPLLRLQQQAGNRATTALVSALRAVRPQSEGGLAGTPARAPGQGLADPPPAPVSVPVGAGGGDGVGGGD